MKSKVINLFENHEVAYSKLIEEFMTPFSSQFKDIEYIEDIFETTITAWNFANMSLILNKIEFNELISSASETGINSDLLLKMIDYKVTNFKAYPNFIVDYELKENTKGPILTVIAQEPNEYFSTMSDNLEDLDISGEYEENFINRYAIIIKPLQPFVDWHNNLYPESPIENFETDVYLINDEIKNLELWVKKKFDKLFTWKLNEWHTDKKKWPQKRSYKMFKQWFQVQVSIDVFDFENKPVSKL